MKNLITLGLLATTMVLANNAHAASQGGEGESCRESSDCQEGLRCVDDVCGAKKRTKHSDADESETRSSSDGAQRAGTILTVTGAISLGAFWLATGIATGVVVATTKNSRVTPAGEAWVPIAGPYIMLADSARYTDTQTAATVTAAVLQTLATTTLITGLIVLAASSSGKERNAAWIAPMTLKDGGGLSVVGRF